MRLLAGIGIVAGATAATALLAFGVADSQSATDEEIWTAVAWATAIASLLSAAIFVYWDALTLKRVGIQVGKNTPGGWGAFVFLFALIGIPLYLVHRSELRVPGVLPEGPKPVRRDAGDRMPPVLAALVGLAIVGMMMIGPWITLMTAASIVPANSPPSTFSVPRTTTITALNPTSDTTWVEDEVENQLSRRGVAATVACPPTTWTTGKVFYCTARDGFGDSARVRIDVTSSNTFIWEVVG